ncbi:MAG: trimethylamine methyltransferase, partial [Acidiferrobacteraceae bacterium]|nr:trimethylamine methyltransferase [Acidiferrobacteraceae bacterium]
MARRTRTARGRSKRSANTSLSGHIRRSLPFFEVLEEEQIVRLETQVDWIMQDVGIAFRDDPKALQLWQQHGAQIEGDIVRAPADWVRDLCAKAPSQFTQLARNPARSVTIGGKHQVFAPIYGAPFVR